MTSEYGKTIKKRLIDLDKSQKWLFERVYEETGLFLDSSYLGKIISGKNKAPKIVAAINAILDIREGL